MTTLTNTARDRFLSALDSSFTEGVGGVFYPNEDGVPLVRISLNKVGYLVERRRKQEAPWSPVTSVRFSQFDPESFGRWLRLWPLVQ